MLRALQWVLLLRDSLNGHIKVLKESQLKSEKLCIDCPAHHSLIAADKKAMLYKI